MNVALLQIELDASSPARNLQRVLGAIERAAAAEPPPDLLVLPGACDTGGAVAGATFPVSIMQNIREAIAFKAREWGIYIAVGLHAAGPDGYLHSPVLLDPDADAAAVHAPRGGGGDDEFANARWCSTVGDIEIRAIGEDVDGPVVDSVPSRGLLIVVPLQAGASVNPSASGAHWAIVRSAGSASKRGARAPGRTRFVGPDGKDGPSVDPAKEAVVRSSVPLRPATSEERAARQLARREIE